LLNGQKQLITRIFLLFRLPTCLGISYCYSIALHFTFGPVRPSSKNRGKGPFRRERQLCHWLPHVREPARQYAFFASVIRLHAIPRDTVIAARQREVDFLAASSSPMSRNSSASAMPPEVTIIHSATSFCGVDASASMFSPHRCFSRTNGLEYFNGFRGFLVLFTDTSEHIRFYFLVFSFPLFSLVPCGRIS